VRLVIAGGGTGGHLFPGVAVAEEFTKRDPGNAVLFIGTERGLEKKVLEKIGFALRTIPVEGIKGKSMGRVISALLKIPHALIASGKFIRSFRPDIVLGVGGYASGPAVMAAHCMGIRTAIAEQNALPGITNKILGRIADRVFVSFAESARWFPPGKVAVTGNPIRSSFVPQDRERGESREMSTLLVFGGSQGARAVNRAVLAALSHLEGLRGKLTIIHQTGERDCPSVSEAYRAAGVSAEVLPFIMDMAGAFARADVIVCRAGATSIAEITASGKASILIPYPHAVADHQTKNAEILAKAGAALLIPEQDLDGRRLAEAVLSLCLQPEKMRTMEKNARGLGHPRAAAVLVDACLAMTGKGKHT
jgi:UDP-N-acetylglucosamine--N-acetylmuramyl-(pentapeptide) pyrophosphoryl-undecaprenol N-acetylglucosamine transferase